MSLVYALLILAGIAASFTALALALGELAWLAIDR